MPQPWPRGPIRPETGFRRYQGEARPEGRGRAIRERQKVEILTNRFLLSIRVSFSIFRYFASRAHYSNARIRMNSILRLSVVCQTYRLQTVVV